MNILTDCIRSDAEYSPLLKTVETDFSAANPLPLLVNGLCEGAADAFYVSLVRDIREKHKECVLFLCAEEKECVRVKSLFKRFGLRAAFYMSRDLTFYNITASREYEHERLKVLSGLIGGDFDVVVTTPDAALGYTIPGKKLWENTLSVDFDTRTEPSVLASELVGAGYSRVDMVDGIGQFAIRGGIIDVYPPYATYVDSDGESHSGAFPLRIELFGDEIDRMGLFELETQRITLNIEAAEFQPAKEIIADKETLKKIRAAVGSRFKQTSDERVCEELISEAAALDAAIEGLDGDGAQSCEINFIDKYISLVYPEKECLLDYFSKRTVVFVRSTNAIADRIKASEWHLNETVKELVEGGTIAPRYTDYAKPSAELELFLSKNIPVHVDSIAGGMSGKKLAGMFNFRSKHTVSYCEKIELLFEDLDNYIYRGYRNIVIAENEASAKNIYGTLKDKKYIAYLEGGEGFDESHLPVGSVLVKWKSFIGGYELVAAKYAILSANPESKSGHLSTGGKSAKRKKKKTAAETILSYNDLEVGDYIVHEDYGIGQYMGIQNLTVSGVCRDYISIKYAGSDQLFLPVEKLDKVSKYIGAHSDDGLVKLSKFGGTEWGRTKAKAKSAVKDMAKDLIKLYAERARREGYAFPADDEFQRDFEASFEYEETDAQLNAVDEIKHDMMKSTPMDRLLCGDVGYGKTEVAIRAAYKAVMGGKQVAILVPTTILALQHYQTILSRMRGYAVNVDMVSRFRTPKQIEQSLRRLARGETDIIIGTHRLISKDVKFNDLGLLIVDEEQRFGVAQKEKLKQLAGNIDVLTLSATPIPRTLNMAMGGIRDISVLDEAPGDRLPVQTYVLEDDELIIMEAIRRELRRGGQVFYMHNFVESIDGVAAKLAKHLPEARITVAHGKMEREQLEDIWHSMLSGETDILVSTSIIETGIDVPNANTLIVDNAHRLGLSQLHQLRGRVGRSSRRAYAYFTHPKNRALTDIAEKRLEAVREYAEFGAGFKIAMRDLELRGAGNLLGSQQHGHLDAVGYDLYIKLLNEAVLEERGESVEKAPECTVTLNYNAYIPDSYVKYPAQRMGLYKKIALITNEYDRVDIMDEMIDRYGNLPVPAQNLLMISLIRANALQCGINTIEQDGMNIKIFPAHIDIDIWSELSEISGGRLKMVMASKTYVNLRLKKEDNGLKTINNLLEKYLEIAQRT